MFFSINKFCDKNEFLEIIDKKKYKNKFFPLQFTSELIRKLLKRLRIKIILIYIIKKYLLNILILSFTILIKIIFVKKFMGLII